MKHLRCVTGCLALGILLVACGGVVSSPQSPLQFTSPRPTPIPTATSVTVPPPPGYPTGQPWPPRITPATPIPAATARPFPTPAFLPMPTGKRPDQLQRLWFPYFPNPASSPQLRAVLVDQVGQQWGQSENLVGLELKAGYPGPRLVGLYASPDAKYIAADVFYGDNGSIWLIEPASSRVQRILKDKESMVHFIAWSPDSQKLLVRAESTKGEIWLVHVLTERYQRLALPTDKAGSTTAQSAIFSPNGAQIAYATVVQPTAPNQASYIELWTMNLDGSDKQQLLKDQGAGVVEGSLLWSNTMNYLVYVKQPDLNNPTASGELWALNLSTYTSKRLDMEVAAAWPSRPILSPNGEMIAFVKGNGELWTFNLRTNRAKQISNPSGGSAVNPVWSPNGAFLAFTANQSDHAVILVASVDGVQVYPVAGPSPVESPIVWLP